MRRRLVHIHSNWYMDDWTRSKCLSLLADLRRPHLSEADKAMMRRQYLLLRYRISVYHKIRPSYFVLLDGLPILLFARPSDSISEHLRRLREVHQLDAGVSFEGVTLTDALTFEKAGIPLGATLRLV